MQFKILFLFLTLISFCSNAQKFGYIDTEYIINKMPEYKKAEELLNQFTDKWSKDIQSKYTEIEKLKDYKYGFSTDIESTKAPKGLKLKYLRTNY